MSRPGNREQFDSLRAALWMVSSRVKEPASRAPKRSARRKSDHVRTAAQACAETRGTVKRRAGPALRSPYQGLLSPDRICTCSACQFCTNDMDELAAIVRRAGELGQAIDGQIGSAKPAARRH
jgi:hypothetical protein